MKISLDWLKDYIKLQQTPEEIEHLLTSSGLEVESLEETEPSSPAWLPLAKKLAEKVEHHLKEEEHRFFQMAGKLLTEKQKTALAADYRADYEEALAATA